jgi:hypothetical protein
MQPHHNESDYAPSVLVVPMSITELPANFKTSSFLNNDERGLLTFLIEKGKNGGQGVPFLRAWLNQTSHSKYDVQQTWSRLLARKLVLTERSHDAVTGRWLHIYRINLNPLLLVEYKKKQRESITRCLDASVLETILTEHRVGKIETHDAIKAIWNVKKIAITASQTKPTDAPAETSDTSTEPSLSITSITDFSQFWDLHTEHMNRILANEVLVLQIQERCAAQGFEFSKSIFIDLEHNIRFHKTKPFSKPYKSFDNYFNRLWDFLGKFNPKNKNKGGGQNYRFNKAKKMAQSPKSHISEEAWTECVFNLISFEPKTGEGILSDGDKFLQEEFKKDRDNGTLSQRYIENGGKLPSPKVVSKSIVTTDATPVSPSAATKTVKMYFKVIEGRVNVYNLNGDYENMFSHLCKLLEKSEIILAQFIDFLERMFAYLEKEGKVAIAKRLKTLLENQLCPPMYDTPLKAREMFLAGILNEQIFEQKMKVFEIWEAARCDDALKKMIT